LLGRLGRVLSIALLIRILPFNEGLFGINTYDSEIHGILQAFAKKFEKLVDIKALTYNHKVS